MHSISLFTYGILILYSGCTASFLNFKKTVPNDGLDLRRVQDFIEKNPEKLKNFLLFPQKTISDALRNLTVQLYQRYMTIPAFTSGDGRKVIRPCQKAIQLLHDKILETLNKYDQIVEEQTSDIINKIQKINKKIKRTFDALKKLSDP